MIFFKFLFDEILKRTDYLINIYISFMEIYNEQAYDLLDKSHIDSPIENWEKINFYEDDYGNISFKNLTIQKCGSEKEGIEYLMMGNFVRQVSSTPMNQCSSRSHCVFTILIEGKNKLNEEEAQKNLFN